MAYTKYFSVVWVRGGVKCSDITGRYRASQNTYRIGRYD